MLSQIKAPQETLYTYVEWKTLEQRKAQYEHNKRIYYLKQKLVGFVMVIIGIMTPVLLDGDATISLILLPLGLYLIGTKQRVMTF